MQQTNELHNVNSGLEVGMLLMLGSKDKQVLLILLIYVCHQYVVYGGHLLTHNDVHVTTMYTASRL